MSIGIHQSGRNSAGIADGLSVQLNHPLAAAHEGNDSLQAAVEDFDDFDDDDFDDEFDDDFEEDWDDDFSEDDEFADISDEDGDEDVEFSGEEE